MEVWELCWWLLDLVFHFLQSLLVDVLTLRKLLLLIWWIHWDRLLFGIQGLVLTFFIQNCFVYERFSSSSVQRLLKLWMKICQRMVVTQWFFLLAYLHVNETVAGTFGAFENFLFWILLDLLWRLLNRLLGLGGAVHILFVKCWAHWFWGWLLQKGGAIDWLSLIIGYSLISIRVSLDSAEIEWLASTTMRFPTSQIWNEVDGRILKVIQIDSATASLHRDRSRSKSCRLCASLSLSCHLRVLYNLVILQIYPRYFGSRRKLLHDHVLFHMCLEWLLIFGTALYAFRFAIMRNRRTRLWRRLWIWILSSTAAWQQFLSHVSCLDRFKQWPGLVFRFLFWIHEQVLLVLPQLPILLKIDASSFW